MTFTQARFTSFEEYLTADPSDLPEGRCEYWDGELVPVMAESGFNAFLANWLFFALVSAGVPIVLLRPHSCEVEVPGNPRTRYPDLTVLDEVHVPLIAKNERITRKMPPPPMVVEVVSPGDEKSDNYKRDYESKRNQYAAIGIPEYWLVDPEREWVKVGTLTDGAYQFATFRGDDAIASPTFPKLKLTAAAVLSAGQ